MGGRKYSKDKTREAAVEKGDDRWVFRMMSHKKLAIPLLLLLAGIVWFGFYATHTKEISGSDDREYVSIAKNIVNGKGIVRNFIYPVDINFFKKLPVPEFVHPPGYPLILAGFFKVFGTSDFVALLPSYLSYFILLCLLFFFAKRFIDVKVATVAGLILIFNKEILDLSLVALSEIVYTLAFFLFFVFFVEAKSIKAIFVSGILLGVSHLIRENIYPFLIPLIIYLYFYPDTPRWKKMLFFVIGFLIPIIPNMIRSAMDTGSPFFSYGKFTLMAFSDKYPWLNIYRGIENPSFFEFLTEEPGQFFVKYLSNLVTAFEQVMSVSNSYVLAFFVVEMFYWRIPPEWKRVKILFLLLLISQILFVSLFTFTHRFFIPLLPMIILFASQGFFRISGDLISAITMRWVKGIFFLIVFVFFVFFIISPIYTIVKPDKPSALGFKTPQYGLLLPKEEAHRLNEFLEKELKGNDIVWTDLPEILEWEGNRLCGWLPIRIGTIYEIHKRIPVDAILLTSVRTPHQMEEEWRYLLFSEHSLPKYRNVKLYRSGRLFAKLLIRNEED